MHITNPVKKYSSDTAAYYASSSVITDLIKTLGAGYAIQKHDIFSRTPYSSTRTTDSYLEKIF